VTAFSVAVLEGPGGRLIRGGSISGGFCGGLPSPLVGGPCAGPSFEYPAVTVIDYQVHGWLDFTAQAREQDRGIRPACPPAFQSGLDGRLVCPLNANESWSRAFRPAFDGTATTCRGGLMAGPGGLTSLSGLD
jgi:hypothetical protein